MTERKEVPTAEKNQRAGGGCTGATQEDPEALKPEGDKPEK